MYGKGVPLKPTRYLGTWAIIEVHYLLNSNYKGDKCL